MTVHRVLHRWHYLLLYSLVLLSGTPCASAQAIWSNATYPDETGFQQRITGALDHIFAQNFGQRSLAPSQCPDTGLPVKTWAVKGETIISPYTGRTYLQGETGYFGPKTKNEKGEIIAFGGDPLKYDLSPAMAALLVAKDTLRAKAFLNIPGNLRQQYHFACANWARFYPLLKDRMGIDWQRQFQQAADDYIETQRHPSDPNLSRQLTHPHTLVGNPDFLLGGHNIDGGTENHKTMWRTSALVYAEQFPDTAKISGLPVDEAAAVTKEILRDYLKKLLYVGNGEYDSDVYYPYTIEGFLNLYDFAKDGETKLLAKFALDYYFATYGLKVVNGAIAGGQKRGYLPKSSPGKMETLLWTFFDNTSRPMTEDYPGIHQATTTYRPNQVIWNIMRQQLALPFEARISRPFYHMDRYNGFQESFYRSSSFALGNVAMAIMDNPNQQMVWSLLVEGKDGPLGFTGGQPKRLTTSAHSVYTQTMHSKGTLLLLSAPTGIPPKDFVSKFSIAENRVNPWHLPDAVQATDYELEHRLHFGATPLNSISQPDLNDAKSVETFWQTKEQASSWLLVPKGVDSIWQQQNYIFIKANQTWISVRPLQDDFFWLSPKEAVIQQIKIKSLRQLLSDYAVLVVPGVTSGYVLDVVEGEKFASATAFANAVLERTKIKLKQQTLTYQSLYGEKLQLRYNPLGLRAAAWVDGKKLDYENWTAGAVYQNPYVKVKEGVLQVSDGKQGYQVDFRGDLPVYKSLD